MKTMKKIVAILAAALMLCSILPLSVFAAEETVTMVASEIGLSNSADFTKWSSDPVTITAAKGSGSNAPKYYSSGTSLRIYGNNTMTISVADGYVLKSVVIKTATGSSYLMSSGNTSVTGATAAYSSATVTLTPDADATEITLKRTASSGHWRVQQVAVTYDANSDVPACEHEWNDATCTDPKTCALCGATDGSALGHSYGEAVETVAPDCVNAGEQESVCSVCNDVKTETVKALGHNYVDGVCSECSEVMPNEITIETFGTTGVLASDGKSISWTKDGFQFVNNKDGSSSSFRTSDADHYRVYKNSEVVISGLNGEKLAKVVIVCTGSSYLFSMNGNTTNDGWAVSVEGNVVTYTATSGAADELIISIDGGQSRCSSVTITPYTSSSCEHEYVGAETQAPTCTAEGVMTYTCSKCGNEYTEGIDMADHSYGEGVETSAPDCTTAGETTYTCGGCGATKTEVIEATGHNYVDDVCSNCSDVKAYKGTIDFSTTEQRTEYATSAQKWENGGLTFVNNKAASTTNIGDFSNPVRIYKSSEIIISFPEMVTLIIDAPTSKDYAWDTTLTNAGLEFTVRNGVYTITFAEPVDSITLTAANQVRANTITARALCEHVWDADCDAECNKCGATREASHEYFNDCETVCMICYEETREASHNVIHAEAVAATCAAGGNIEYWYCDVCGQAWLDETCIMNTNLRAVKTSATGEHTYANDFDVDCDECGAVREVAFPMPSIGKSISEDVSGYAVLFDAEVENLVLAEDGSADYSNATYNDYKLLGLGVTASNGKSEATIEGVRVYGINDETGNLQFAFRIVNIPEANYESEITMVPYYTVEIDGVATTIEGEAVIGSYAEIAG